MSKKAFDGQREDEEVEFVFRKHILTARKGIWFLMAMIIIGVAPMVVWSDTAWLFWVFLGCVIVGVIGCLYEHISWHFSVYVVTNQRIRQISQRGLFRKTVVDLGLDKIQSISYNIPGLRGGLFGFGTILIQTQVGDMTISMVPKPEKVYNKLQDAMGGVNGE